MATNKRDQCPQCSNIKMATSALCAKCNGKLVAATNKANAEAAIAYRNREVQLPMKCPHFWDIEPPQGEQSWARCRNCGEGKLLSNSLKPEQVAQTRGKNTIDLTSYGSDGLREAEYLTREVTGNSMRNLGGVLL